MGKRFRFDFSDGVVKISARGKTDTTETAESMLLRLIDRKEQFSEDRSAVYVCEELFSKYSDKKMLLINPDNSAFIEVNLRKSDIASGYLGATTEVKRHLDVQDKAELYLCDYREYAIFNKVKPQRIEHIRENNVVVSRKTYERIAASGFRLFEIYNSRTKENITIQKTHFVPDDSLGDGEVRLNKRQRYWLGCEAPLFIDSEDWTSMYSVLSDAEKECIDKAYDKETHILTEDCTFEDRKRAAEILKEKFADKIVVVPVIESFLDHRIRGPLQRLSDFFVGKSTLSLTCRRPYITDDGANIVRISAANMKLLGIDEMDRVILRHRNRKVKCRVLSLDDERAFKEANTPVLTDLAIGIPVQLRKELGIRDMKSSVKIDRDTGFIFRRTFKDQIIPLLLTLFSTNLFALLSKLAAIAFVIIAVPLVIYFNLSSKRNMRA